MVPELRWHNMDEEGNISVHNLGVDFAQQLSVFSRESRDDHVMAMAYIEQAYERRRDTSTDKNDRSWSFITPKDVRFATAHYTREKEKEGARKARLEQYRTKRKREILTKEANEQDYKRFGHRKTWRFRTKRRLFVSLKLKPEFLRKFPHEERPTEPASVSFPTIPSSSGSQPARVSPHLQQPTSTLCPLSSYPHQSDTVSLKLQRHD